MFRFVNGHQEESGVPTPMREIAARAGVGAFAAVGESVTAYVRQRRLEEARLARAGWSEQVVGLSCLDVLDEGAEGFAVSVT
ncbi:hypothetical protein [Streptomyces sp. 2A115]|uniref:hypothetical protein n=1 Tax=Streptomyces sp. 2A115 TaxID=3457439 RepID=UPI003FD025CD